MCHKQSKITPGKAKYLVSAAACLLSAFLYCAPADAGNILKFDPFISVEEKYDDNIYLRSSDKRSDWITSVVPGFSTSISNPRVSADLRYEPGFVYFLHNPENDYTSHELTFNGRAELTSQLTASLYEFYLRSNDPDLDEMADTDYQRSLRRDNREIFNTHIIAPQLAYSYGRDNVIRLYYRNTNYKSEDPEEDDYRENFFEGRLDHWFDVKNGVTLLCHFVKGNFDLDTDLLHSIEIVPRYRYRFTPHFELYGEYGYGTAEFEERRFYTTLQNGRLVQTGLDDSEDYDLHKFSGGFEWQLPHNLRLLGGLGYFWREGVGNNDEQGIASELTVEKATKNMRLNVGWESGYSANYFAVRDEGFTKFWEFTTGASYTHHQNLELRLRGSYGYEEYTSDRGTTSFEDEREDYRYLVLFQITYHILRNYGLLSDLALDFSFNHRELDSDVDTESYINNQTVARITATF